MKWSGISGCIYLACHHTHLGTYMAFIKYTTISLYDYIVVFSYDTTLSATCHSLADKWAKVVVNIH